MPSVDIKGEIKEAINKKIDSYNAITELIDDSIDAGATCVRITFTSNLLRNIDDGTGFTDGSWNDIDELKKLKERSFLALGSFGIGRIRALCALAKSDGGRIATLTLSKDRTNVRSHEFKYDISDDDILISSNKEGNGEEVKVFLKDVLDTDINSITREEEGKLLEGNTGTLTVIHTNNKIDRDGYTNDIIKGKLSITYLGYLNQGNKILYNGSEIKQFDRLHLNEPDSESRSYQYKLHISNDLPAFAATEGSPIPDPRFYITHDNNRLNIPANSGPTNKSLGEMYTGYTEGINDTLLSEFSITLCRISQHSHASDCKCMEFLKKGGTGRLTTYICGVSITRNGLREMGAPREVISWNDDINTNYLNKLRGMIDYKICGELTEKQQIDVNGFFGVTSEKDLIGDLNNMLKKLTKCLVYKDCGLFHKPKPTDSEPIQSKPIQSKPIQSKPIQSKPIQSKPTEKVNGFVPYRPPVQSIRGGSIESGYLYLWTLDGSDDWKIDADIIYNFGQTKRNYNERIRDHQRNHPAKIIKIEAIWKIHGNILNKETECLAKFQELGYQYKAFGTRTSEYIKSDNSKEIIDIVNGLVPPNSQLPIKMVKET